MAESQTITSKEDRYLYELSVKRFGPELMTYFNTKLVVSCIHCGNDLGTYSSEIAEFCLCGRNTDESIVNIRNQLLDTSVEELKRKYLTQ